MNMQKLTYLICGAVLAVGLLAGCHKHTYDFSYSPTNPKAGARVSFINQSDAGESWVWKFGDGNISTLKSPTHVYTKAGTYTVELMADSNKSRTITHILEVLDSLPSISLKSDTVRQYQALTMKAALYNPTKAKVTYLWEVDESLFELTKGSLTGDSVVGYFTNYGRTTEIKLTTTVGGKTTTDSRTIVLVDNDAPTLVMETADGALWRQRIYNGIYESVKPYEGDPLVILEANDSLGVLNGVTYDIHDMPVLTDKNVKALQVDAINRKLYVILDDGLYVANANGDHLEQISDTPAQTLLIDSEQNSLYWSDSNGVWVMPLVTNPQNIIGEQLREKITQVNELESVEKMTVEREN